MKKRLRPINVMYAVLYVTGVSMEDMCGDTRIKPVVRARRVFVFLCRELTHASYPEIAREMGRRSHTQAIYQYRDFIRQYKAKDAALIEAYTIAALHLSGRTEKRAGALAGQMMENAA